MYEYFCNECDIHELSCKVEAKKTCPDCGLYMDVNETEGAV